jgi:hypothetical protein
MRTMNYDLKVLHISIQYLISCMDELIGEESPHFRSQIITQGEVSHRFHPHNLRTCHLMRTELTMVLNKHIHDVERYLNQRDDEEEIGKL